LIGKLESAPSVLPRQIISRPSQQDHYLIGIDNDHDMRDRAGHFRLSSIGPLINFAMANFTQLVRTVKRG
jgi:hypothetical protein